MHLNIANCQRVGFVFNENGYLVLETSAVEMVQPFSVKFGGFGEKTVQELSRSLRVKHFKDKRDKDKT